MLIEPTVSVGNIITSIATLGAIIIGVWRVIARLSRMEMKLNLLWKWFEKEHNISNGEDK